MKQTDLNEKGILAVRQLLDDLLQKKTPNPGGGIRPIDYDVNCVKRTLAILTLNN